jgi:hypothetical integral membrane protein (TIGR02206 family)
MIARVGSWVRLGIVSAVLAAAAILARLARDRPAAARRIQLGLAAAIAVNELAWYGYVVGQGWVRPPHGLPLDLCDVVLWLAVWALVRPTPWVRDAVWYLGVAGSGMAVLTPDIAAPLSSYPAAVFFLAHGMVVVAALFLVWSGAHRPRPGSWWRVFLWANAYAAAVGAFDAAFGTNYMYLCEKPRSATLLDWLGPWPWYVVAAEPVALLLLGLLYLPFARFSGSPASPRGGAGRRPGCGPRPAARPPDRGPPSAPSS